MNKKEILRMENITNTEDQRVALKSGRLYLFENEIVGIAGLNYSGETTLVGAIAGFAPYEKGVTYLYGKKVRITSIAQSKRLGIHCIRQPYSLINEFTVEQNIRFQPLFNSGLLVKANHNRELFESLFAIFHIKFKHEDITGNLDQSEKMLVEIMKAVFAGVKIIIFDNNLHLLGGNPNIVLGDLLNTLRSLDISVVLIDTGVKLLTELCDRIFVMRKGNTVSVFEKDQMDEATIVEIMHGSYLENTNILRLTENAYSSNDKLMEWDHVHYNGILNGISFSVNHNEVLGLLNMDKSYGDAIKEVLLGTRYPVFGSIRFCNVDLKRIPGDKLTEMGLVVIPEEDTVFPLLSAAENIELSAVKKHSDFIGRIKKNDLKFDMEQLIDAFLKKDEQLYFKQLLVPDDKLTRRRIVICRALMTQPKLILMMHPTDTMDGIKIDEMSTSIRKIRDFGCSAIVVSMDADFLIKTCSRVLVLDKGIIEAYFTINQQNNNQLLHEYVRNRTNL